MQLLCNIRDELYRKWEVSDFSLQESLEFVRCVINGKPLSKNVTNGEVLCILFPNMHYTVSEKSPRVVTTIGVASSFDTDWWNAPYGAESEVQDADSN